DHSILPYFPSTLNGEQYTDDIEVVTYDEIPGIIEEKEAIHEIIQPFDEMGKIAIEKMESIIKKQETISQIVIQPDFIIKEKLEQRINAGLIKETVQRR
ncbi:MAG TPA: hypothetical protein PLW07_05370, partial [bacterium]|nr:hypothetical protein [bacterium]